MSTSAPPAKPAEPSTPSAPSKSSTSSSGHVLQRIEAFKAEHPEATEYLITTELEAEQVLLAIAATLKCILDDVHDRDSKAEIKKIGQQYRLAVVQGRALDFIREIAAADETALEIHGVRIVVPPKVLQ